MVAHNFVVRPTYDVDLFTTEPGGVARAAAALTKQLAARGFLVARRRHTPTFVELDVRAPDGRELGVQVCYDARIRPTVMLAVGRVLHPEEIAARDTPLRASRSTAPTSPGATKARGARDVMGRAPN